MGLDAGSCLWFDLFVLEILPSPDCVCVRVCHFRRVGVISLHGYCHIMQTDSYMLKMPPHENHSRLSALPPVRAQIWHFACRLCLVSGVIACFIPPICVSVVLYQPISASVIFRGEVLSERTAGRL